jgi:hypothetical protein
VAGRGFAAVRGCTGRTAVRAAAGGARGRRLCAESPPSQREAPVPRGSAGPAPAARHGWSRTAAIVAGPAHTPAARQSTDRGGPRCRVTSAYPGGATINRSAGQLCRATGSGARPIPPPQRLQSRTRYTPASRMRPKAPPPCFASHTAVAAGRKCDRKHRHGALAQHRARRVYRARPKVPQRQLPGAARQQRARSAHPQSVCPTRAAAPAGNGIEGCALRARCLSVACRMPGGGRRCPIQCASALH